MLDLPMAADLEPRQWHPRTMTAWGWIVCEAWLEGLREAYRQYAHAVRGTTVPASNFYELTADERETWIERGLAAATVTGL